MEKLEKSEKKLSKAKENGKIWKSAKPTERKWKSLKISRTHRKKMENLKIPNYHRKKMEKSGNQHDPETIWNKYGNYFL